MRASSQNHIEFLLISSRRLQLILPQELRHPLLIRLPQRVRLREREEL
jgi:hypothetical protein